jgi:MFS family permease
MSGVAPARSEFARGWPVLAACLVGVTVGASPIPYNTLGFFLPELAREFGWGYARISLGVTVYGVVGALLAPLFGAWADRHGARRVAVLSLPLFALMFGSLALTPGSLAVYYAQWTLIGLVAIGSTPVVFSRLVNQWFFRRRGLALGIMLLGTSLAAVILPPLVTWAIAHHGWRTAYLVVAALPLLVGLPVAALLLRQPREHEAPAVASTSLHGRSLAEAMADRRFWILWASIALVSFAFGGAYVHMPEIVRLHGYAPSDAAHVMQALGLSILCGRLCTGFLLDRYWAPAVCLPILSIPALACLVLAGDTPGWPLLLGGAALLGFAAGAESDLIAYLASRYFGLAHYGKIYGMLYMPFVLSSAFSPAAYGAVRDATGGYAPMLQASAVMFVAGALLLLALGRYPEAAPARPA